LNKRQKRGRKKAPLAAIIYEGEPSPMDKLLALVEAERRRKGRTTKVPSSRKRTGEEVWEETTTQAEKLNTL
jgi:hypothetical protein